MADTEQFYRVARLIEAAGAKLITVGDKEQLKPIGHGNPLKVSIDQVGESTLKHNWRQSPIEAQAALHVRNGDAKQALELYRQKGDIILTKNRQSAIKRLVADWKEIGLRTPENITVLAQTNHEVRQLNRLCQAARLESGAIKPKHIALDEFNIHVGERIRFRETSHLRGIKNGDKAVVLSIDLRGNVTVQLDKKFSSKEEKRGLKTLVKFAPAELRELKTQLGYAATVNSFQGSENMHVQVLLGGNQSDRNMSYVQLTRSTKQCRLYLDRATAGPELETIAKIMNKRVEKLNAHDHGVEHAHSLEKK
jgi:ATP-dependent exoDNAse (exonuclease V) alpha subunit